MSTAVEGRLNITPAPSIYTTEVTDSNVRELRRSFSRFEAGSATVTNFVATPNPFGAWGWGFTSESDVLFKSGKLKSLEVSVFGFDKIAGKSVGVGDEVETFRKLQSQAQTIGIDPKNIKAHTGVVTTADGRVKNEEILHWKGEWGRLNQESISQFISSLQKEFKAVSEQYSENGKQYVKVTKEDGSTQAVRVPTEQSTMRTGMFTGVALGNLQLTGSGGFINERAGSIGGTYYDFAFTTNNPYINDLVKEFEANSEARQPKPYTSKHVPGFAITQNETIYKDYNTRLENYIAQIKESKVSQQDLARSGSKVVITAPAMSIAETSISDSARDLNQRQSVLQYVHNVLELSKAGVPVYLKVDPDRIELPPDLMYQLKTSKNVYFAKNYFLDRHAHFNTTYAELNFGDKVQSFIGIGTFRPVGGHSLNFAWVAERLSLGKDKDGSTIVNPEYAQSRRVIDEIFASNYWFQPRRDPALEDGGMLLREFYTPTYKDRQGTSFLEGGKLPYMPTSMPEAFFSYYQKGSQVHMYTRRYQAIYRRDPEGMQAYILGTMDRKLSDPGFGMLLNLRVGQNDLYVPGEGLLSAAVNSIGRLLDTITGFYTFQTIKAQQAGDLYGSLSKYNDKSQTDPYDNRKSRGFFENFFHSVITTLSGTAVSMAAYFGVTHGYNIAKAEIEGVGVQNVLQALQSGHDTRTTKIFTSQLLSRPHQEILMEAGRISTAIGEADRGKAINKYLALVQDVITQDVLDNAAILPASREAAEVRADLATRLEDARLQPVVDSIRGQLAVPNAESIVKYMGDNAQLRQELAELLAGQHSAHNIDDVFSRAYSKLEIHRQSGLINLGHTFSASITGLKVDQLSGFTNLAAVRRMDVSNVQHVFLPLLMEIADVRMGEGAKFERALYNLTQLAKQPPLLDYLRLQAQEGDRGQFAIYNYGFERIENLARTFDEIAEFIPANPFMWFRPFRDAFGNRKTIASLTEGDVEVTSRGSFKELIGPGFSGLLDLTKQVRLAVKQMRTTGVGQHLRSTFDTFAAMRRVERQERAILRAIGGAPVSQIGYHAITQDARISAMFTELNKGLGDLNDLVAAQHVSKSNFKRVEGEGGAFRGFRKAFFSIGTFLLADKLLDTYVFRPQGADLFDTILSDIFGTQAPKVKDPDYADDSRYKGLYETHYSSSVPAAVKYPAAAAGYLAAGYLFPKVYAEEHLLTRFVGRNIAEADRGAVLAALKAKGVLEGAGAVSKIRFSGRAGLLGAAAGLIASQLMTTYLATTLKPTVQAIGSLLTGRYRKYEGGMELDAMYGNIAAGLADIVSSSQQRRKQPGYQDSPSERAAVQTLDMYVQQFTKPRLTPGRTFYPFATQMAFPFFQFASVAKIDPKGNKIDLESGLQLFPLLGVGMMIPFPATPQVKYSNGLVAQQLYTRLNQIPSDVIAPYRQLTTASNAEYESAQRIRAVADVAGIMLGSWLNVSFDYKPLVAIGMLGALGSTSRKLETLVRGLPTNSRLRSELENYRTLYNVTKLGVKATDSLVRGAFSLTTIVSNALIKSTTSLLGVGGAAMVRSGPLARAIAPYYLTSLILGGLIKPTQTGSETELGGINDVLKLFNRGQYEGATSLYMMSLTNQIFHTAVGTAIFGTALAQSGAFDRASEFRGVTGTDFISRKKQQIFSYWEEHLARQGRTVDYAIDRMSVIRQELRTADRITAPGLLAELHKLELPLLRSAPTRYAMAARKVAPLLIGFTAAAQVLALTDFYKNPYLSTLIKAVSDTGRGDWSAEQRAFLSSVGIRGMRYQPKNLGDAARNMVDYLWGSVTFFANNPANVYQDAPNPFLGVLGPLGVSSQQDQARYYFQSQSVAADLSGSLYIMPSMVSDMMTSLELGPALQYLSKAPARRVNGVAQGGLSAKTALALVRGAALRRRPALTRGGIDQSDIGAVTTPELYMALSRRNKELERLSMQSANQHMQDIVRVFALARRIANGDRDGLHSGVRQHRASATIYDSLLSSARLVGWTNSRLTYAKLGQNSATTGDLMRGLRAMGSRLAGYGQGAIEAQDDLGQTLYGDRVQDAGPNPIFGYFRELFKFAFGTFYDPDTGTTGTGSNNLAGALLMAGGASVLAASFIGSSMATLIQMLGAAAALNEQGTVADLAGNVDQMTRNISRRLKNTVYYPNIEGGQIVGVYRWSNRSMGYKPMQGLTDDSLRAINSLLGGGLLQDFAEGTLKDQALALARMSTLEAGSATQLLNVLDTEINSLRTIGGTDIRQLLNPQNTGALSQSLFATNEQLITDIVSLHGQGKTLEARELMIWNRLQEFFFNQLETEQFGYANNFTAEPPRPLAADVRTDYYPKSAMRTAKPAWSYVVNSEAQYINDLIDQKGYSGLFAGSVEGALRGFGAAIDFKAGYEAVSYSAAALADPDAMSRRRASVAAANSLIQTFALIMPAQALLKLASKHPVASMAVAGAAFLGGAYAFADQRFGRAVGNFFSPIFEFGDKQLIQPTANSLAALIQAASNTPLSWVGYAARPVTQFIDPLFVSMRSSVRDNPVLNSMLNLVVPETVESFYDRLAVRSGVRSFWGPRAEIQSQEELTRYRRARAKARRQRASIRNAGIDSDLVSPFLLGRSAGEDNSIQSIFLRRYLGGDGRVLEAFTTDTQLSTLMKTALEQRQGELDQYAVGTSYMRAPYIRRNAYQMLPVAGGLMRYSYASSGAFFKSPMIMTGRIATEAFGMYSTFANLLGRVPNIRSTFAGTSLGLVASSAMYKQDPSKPNWVAPMIGLATGALVGYTAFPRAGAFLNNQAWWQGARKIPGRMGEALGSWGGALGSWARGLANSDTLRAFFGLRGGATPLAGTTLLATAAIYSNYDALYSALVLGDAKKRQDQQARDTWQSKALYSGITGFALTSTTIGSMALGRTRGISTSAFGKGFELVGKGTSGVARFAGISYLINTALHLPYINAVPYGIYDLGIRPLFRLNPEDTESNYNAITQGISLAGAAWITSRPFTYGPRLEAQAVARGSQAVARVLAAYDLGTMTGNPRATLMQVASRYSPDIAAAMPMLAREGALELAQYRALYSSVNYLSQFQGIAQGAGVRAAWISTSTARYQMNQAFEAARIQTDISRQGRTLFDTFRADITDTLKIIGGATFITPAIWLGGKLWSGARKAAGGIARETARAYRRLPAGIRTPISRAGDLIAAPFRWLAPRLGGALDHVLTNPLYGAAEESLEQAATTPTRFAALGRFSKAMVPHLPAGIDLLALGAGGYQITRLSYGRSAQDFQASYSSFYSSLGAITVSSLMALGGRSTGFLRTLSAIVQASRIGAEQGERIGDTRFYDAYDDGTSYQRSKMQELGLGVGAIGLSIGSSVVTNRAFFQSNQFFAGAGNVLPGAAQVVFSSYDIAMYSSSYNQSFSRGDTSYAVARRKSGLLRDFFFGAGTVALSFRPRALLGVKGKAGMARMLLAAMFYLGGFAADAGESNFMKDQDFAFRRAGIYDDYAQNVISRKASESITPGALIGGTLGAVALPVLTAIVTRGRGVRSLSKVIGLGLGGASVGAPSGGFLAYNFSLNSLMNQYATEGLSVEELRERQAWINSSEALPSSYSGTRQAEQIRRARALFKPTPEMRRQGPSIAMAPAPADMIRPEVLEAGAETVHRKAVEETGFGLGEAGLLGIGSTTLLYSAFNSGGFEMLSTAAPKFIGKPLASSLLSHTSLKLVSSVFIPMQWFGLRQELNTVSNYRSSRGAGVDYIEGLAQMRTKAMDTSITSMELAIPPVAKGWADITIGAGIQMVLYSTQGIRRKLFKQQAQQFIEKNHIRITTASGQRALQAYAGAFQDRKANALGLLAGLGTGIALAAFGGFTLPALALAAFAGAGFYLMTKVMTADAIGNRRAQNVLLGRGDKDTGRVSGLDDMAGTLNPYTLVAYGLQAGIAGFATYRALSAYNQRVRQNKTTSSGKLSPVATNETVEAVGTVSEPIINQPQTTEDWGTSRRRVFNDLDDYLNRTSDDLPEFRPPDKDGGFVRVSRKGRLSNTPLDIFARGARQRIGGVSSTFLRGAGQELGFATEGWSAKSFSKSQFNWMAIAGAGLTFVEETQIKGKSTQEALLETGKSLAVGLAAGAVIGGALATLGTTGLFIGGALIVYGAYQLAMQANQIELGLAKKYGWDYNRKYYDAKGRLVGSPYGTTTRVSSAYLYGGSPTRANEQRMVRQLVKQRTSGATYGLAKDRVIAKVDPYKKAEYNRQKDTQRPWWQQLFDWAVGGTNTIGRHIKSGAEWSVGQAKAAAQAAMNAIYSVIGGSLNENELYIANYLAGKGIGRAGIAAILGTFKQESTYQGKSFNPYAVEIGGTGLGIMQWSHDRRSRVPKFTGDWKQDTTNQLDLFFDELERGGKYDDTMAIQAKVLQRLRTAKTTEEGMAAMKDFVRYGVAGSRGRYAEEYFNKLNVQQRGQAGAHGQLVGGAVVLDVKTSHSGGGGAGPYHIDFAFNPNAGFSMADKVRMFEPVVQAYESMGRRIEFSNSAVSGLVYSSNLSQAEKESRLLRAQEAHVGRRSGRNRYPMDFYVPLKGSARYSGGGVTSSTSGGANVSFVIPVIEGGYYTVGKFVPGAGQKITAYDAQGRWVYEAYHGQGGREGTFYFSKSTNAAVTAAQNNPILGMSPEAMVAKHSQGRLTPQQLSQIPIARLQPMINLLYKGEGGINSVNVILRNSKGDRTGTRASTFQAEFGRPAAQVTLGEIRDRQRQTRSLPGRSEIGAVGFPQLIGNTLQGAMDYFGYKLDTRFTKEVQENLFKYLIFIKRPEIGAYLLRNPGATIQEAQQGVAREFASMPLAYPEAPGAQLRASGTKIQEGWDVDRKRQAGQSLYYGIGGNNVRVDAAPLQRALEGSRLDPVVATPSTGLPSPPKKPKVVPVKPVDPLPNIYRRRAYVSPEASDRIVALVAQSDNQAAQLQQAQSFLIEWTAALLKQAKDAKKETVIESIELPNTTAVNPKQYEQRVSKGMRTTKRETKAEVDENLVLLTKVINQRMILDSVASGGICDYESAAKKPRVTAPATA